MLKKIAVLYWKCIARGLVCGLLGVACAKQLPSSGDTAYYVEPTTWIEPVVPLLLQEEATPQVTQLPEGSLYEELDTLLREQRQWRSSRGWLSGYSVQLYKGFSRQEAQNVRAKARRLTTLPTRLSYRQPHYTVWAGFFLKPLAAHGQLVQLQRNFPQSLIVPRQIRNSELIPSNRDPEEEE